MEDMTNNNELNIIDIPRDENGKIDIEKISIGITEKGYHIVSDEILQAYYKELPSGTINESRTKRAMNGGLLKILSKDDIDIQKAGGEALKATYRQRRTNREIIDIIYNRKAPKEAIERLGLDPNATILEAINVAQALESLKGNTKAAEYLRDTAGEKPTDKISAEVEAITAEDRLRIEKILNREKENPDI